jgi:hypothetical protein
MRSLLVFRYGCIRVNQSRNEPGLAVNYYEFVYVNPIPLERRLRSNHAPKTQLCTCAAVEHHSITDLKIWQLLLFYSVPKIRSHEIDCLIPREPGVTKRIPDNNLEKLLTISAPNEQGAAPRSPWPSSVAIIRSSVCDQEADVTQSIWHLFDIVTGMITAWSLDIRL